jgi:DUF438 domain-containing protein
MVTEEMSGLPDEKKKMLKELIRQLHSGAAPQEVKDRFKQVLGTVDSVDIARIEQELVEEGMPREEIHRLCEVHLLVFQEQLEKQKPETPTANPVNILMEEHKIMLQLVEMLGDISKNVQQARNADSMSEDMAHLKHIVEDFRSSEKHYLREENVIFPLLEKHGVKEPPAIMWTEHDGIREEKKRFYNLVENYDAASFEDFKERLAETADSLKEILSSHFFKENNILFPTALSMFTAEEWREVRKEFDAIGYCRFTPQYLIVVPQADSVKEAKLEERILPEGMVKFETGVLPTVVVDAILKTLPVDVTFVDKDDAVVYFNKSDIFMRTRAVIGRKVQQCHPQKSVQIVNRILESFKSGKKDVSEFWIQLKDRLIHIRYFAVRDDKGKYLGTMEVTQDVTDIKKLEGEKRLLDWKD